MIEVSSKERLVRALVSSCVGSVMLATALPASAQETAPASTTTTAPSADASTAAPSTAPSSANATATTSAAAPASEPTKPAEPHEEEEKEREAKRAIYMVFDGAFARVDLGGLSDSLDFTKTGANGGAYGLATGLRLKDFRVGARWRVYDTTEYDIWTIGAQASWGMPTRPLSPVITANVGYVWDQKIEGGAISGALPRGTVMPPDVDVKGLVVGLDVNASYWVTRFLRVGPFVGADVFFLNRQQAKVPASIFTPTAEERAHPLFTGSGSGVSYALSIGLRGAFDIGF